MIYYIVNFLVRRLEAIDWQPRWLSWRRFPAPYFLHYSFEDRNPLYICEQKCIELTVRIGRKKQSFGFESGQCVDE